MRTLLNPQSGCITILMKKLLLNFKKKLGLKWALTSAQVCLNLQFFNNNMKLYSSKKYLHDKEQNNLK